MSSSRPLSTPVPPATIITTSTPLSLQLSPPCSPPHVLPSSSTNATCNTPVAGPSATLQHHPSSPIVVAYSPSPSPFTTPSDVQAVQPPSLASTSYSSLHLSLSPAPSTSTAIDTPVSDVSSQPQAKKEERTAQTNTPVSTVCHVTRRSASVSQLMASENNTEEGPPSANSAPPRYCKFYLSD